MSRHPSSSETSRRRFLKAAAGGGALVGVGGLVSAQSKPQEIRLGGEIAGWQGRAPESIAGETNPTLELDAGRDYRVVWENIDGMGHNFALLDGDGEVLKHTDIMSEQGETQTVEFTASERLAEYVCEPHITSMRGEISFDGKSNESANGTETGAGNESADEEGGPEPFVPKGATVRIETLVDGGLVAPLDFAVPPGTNDRRFIVDRLGQVYVHDESGLSEEPFIDVSEQMVEVTGEMGLLGMAFHPDFQKNRKFYLRYSAPLTDDAPDDFDHTEVLSEFTASEDRSTGMLDSERRVLEIPSPQDTHNAGAVVFGPDGYLYVAMGDGGGAHDDNPGHVDDWYERNDGGNGQDVTENLLGSILRIDVDGREDGKPYAVPEGNPLVGEEGLDEHFAWGFRNPWKMGFSDGKLFVADVGQNLYEEVNIVREDKNYGWNVREGTHCFKPGPEGSRNPPKECPTKLPADTRGGERLIDPVIEYPHSYEGQGVGSAAIGGYVYENETIPALEGKYVFGDFRKTAETETPTGSLFAATPTEEPPWSLEELTIENTESGLLDAYVLAIGRDNAGELYVLTSGTGTVEEESGAVHRLRPPKQPAQASGEGTASGNETANGTASNTTANATSAPTTDGTVTAGGTTASGATGTSTDSATARTLTDTGTAGDASTATERGAGGVSAGSSGSGPGFGVVAALGGITIGAVRLLRRRER